MTKPLQPQDPACGTLFQFNYAIRTSPTDCSDDSWMHTFFREAWTLWLCDFDTRRLRRTLTYLLTYSYVAVLVELRLLTDGHPDSIYRASIPSCGKNSLGRNRSSSRWSFRFRTAHWRRCWRGTQAARWCPRHIRNWWGKCLGGSDW